MAFTVFAADQHTSRTGSFVTTIAADAAGVLVLPTDGLGRQSQIQQGYNFQATAAVTIDFTLAPQHEAISSPASVPWDPVGTASATILDAPGKFPSAIRYTFSGPAVLYVSCM